MFSIKNYNYDDWKTTFTEDVDICDIDINNDNWNNYFGRLKERNMFDNVNKVVNTTLKSGSDVFPYPKLLFNAFDKTDIDDIKVVILGQDPYINSHQYNNVKIPQSMGLSFSVPIGISIPPSLRNIFGNQYTNNIVGRKQPHGNLEEWTSQGCFLLNTALTVKEGTSGSHCNEWKSITDRIIKRISTKLNNIVFVLWGAPALQKKELIDCDKHKIIISSHPSGLSCNKPLRTYPAFIDVDHFGIINKYLIENEVEPIDWQL